MNLEAKNFGYSLKNIPVPSKANYLKSLVEKIESLIIRMRWKALFFSNDDNDSIKELKETYGFRSKKTPPQHELLKAFEEDLIDLIRKVEFEPTKDQFLHKLNHDIKNIKESKDIIVFADKTTNMYNVSKGNYRKILLENVTKSYQKSRSPLVDNINDEAAKLMVDLKIEDRMECFAKKEAFVTFKDHKDNFLNHPKCRLINPAKSEVGKISKVILERINTAIRSTTKLIQWRNSFEVIDWFKGCKPTSNSSFIQFDICEFYPSISKTLLEESIKFAKKFIDVSVKDVEIIMYARESLLFSEKEEWIRKKESMVTDLFDVTMGSYDGAEVCELVGLFLLNQIKERLGKTAEIGLYRDDGLALLPGISAQKAERMKKDLVEVFKENGLKITVDANLKIVHFLDITMNLNNFTYYPFRKPNDNPLYIHKNSNHPKQIIKNLPEMINRRLCDISCNEEVFNKAKPVYTTALRNSGFQDELKYKTYEKSSKNRRRNVMYFNPPFSKNVKTNIGKEFLKLVSKHFTPDHKLRPLFNKNNLKISYSCMPNVEKIIKAHNVKILNDVEEGSRKCNCRRKNLCPLRGECLTECVVYKAEVSSEDGKKVYYGSCEGSFKERFTNHQKSINRKEYRKETRLSQYVWNLKDRKKQFEIAWCIVKKCSPYKPASRKCDLCLTEKLVIVEGDSKLMLNERSEIANKCRHSNKFSYRTVLKKKFLKILK